MNDIQHRPIDWTNAIFLAAVHVVGVVGAGLYAWAYGISWPIVGMALAWTALTIFAISAGYHRLFSHRTYEAHPAFRVFLLMFGASSFQTSALTWSANHRRHHSRTDSDEDPYDARRGFWHAHVGWVIQSNDPNKPLMQVPDLEADKWLRWQHKHHVLLAATVGLVAPTLIGLALGDALGGFLLGGAARLVFVYQVTFAVNSLVHMVGTQPYSDRNSSRDSVIGALLTMGEGYHNFHHTFPGDYRNGVMWFQFDPTKWVVYALSRVGLATNLRRTPAPAVLRARARMAAKTRLTSQALPSAIETLRQTSTRRRVARA